MESAFDLQYVKTELAGMPGENCCIMLMGNCPPVMILFGNPERSSRRSASENFHRYMAVHGEIADVKFGNTILHQLRI